MTLAVQKNELRFHCMHVTIVVRTLISTNLRWPKYNIIISANSSARTLNEAYTRVFWPALVPKLAGVNVAQSQSDLGVDCGAKTDRRQYRPISLGHVLQWFAKEGLKRIAIFEIKFSMNFSGYISQKRSRTASVGVVTMSFPTLGGS